MGIPALIDGWSEIVFLSFRLCKGKLPRQLRYRGFLNDLARDLIGTCFPILEELKTAIENFIDYYNHFHIKEKLGWESPVEFRLDQQNK